MNDIKILFEDKYYIAVIKPYGVLSQGNENTHSICNDISSYLKQKNENGDVYVVHRLDKTTGGVMVFAKTKTAAKKLSELITQGGFHKVYHCVTQGILNDNSGELTDLLYHDKNKNKTYVVKRERKGVKTAKLSYTVLNTATIDNKPVSKIEVKLHTGRTHQIRVQFASRKHPLVGDRKYGSDIESKTIALWSYQQSFTHPFTEKEIEISAEPEHDIFNMFS